MAKSKSTDSSLRKEPRCKTCFYLLRELERNVCPECGRAFDLDDRSSYCYRKNESSWRDYASPPPTWHLVLLSLIALHYLYGASFPLSPNIFLPCLLSIVMFVGAPFFVFAYIRRAIACYKAKNDGLPKPSDFKIYHRRNWIGLLLPIAIVLSTFIYNWPLKLRWELSKPAFDATVKVIETGKPAPATPRWIGAYYVYRVDVYVEQGTFVGFITGDTIGDPCGFEYSFSGQPVGTIYSPFQYIDVDLGAGWSEREW